jgi:hypothetical protein
MPLPLYEQCLTGHRALHTGTFGWPEEYDRSVRQFRVRTCGAERCVRSANRECRSWTGHDGTFIPFPQGFRH